MKQSLFLLAALFVASLLSVLSPADAEAASLRLSMPAAPAQAQSSLLQLAGYYGGHHQKSYDDDDGYGHGDDGYGHGRHCGTSYAKKWVCEQTEPRCFKQRECIWYYGKEYCRYVHKCVGGERYCKWVHVPVPDCGCHDCD
jgi:hypothetical protein